jgi:hypothetical protein
MGGGGGVKMNLPPMVGVDVKVILTPSCLFCIENH